MLKSKKWFVGVLAAGLSSVAMAGLSAADLSTQGDGLLTLDSQTGLAWLDLSQTMGQSLSQVVAANWLAQGFRLATRQDVADLLAHGVAQAPFLALLGGMPASSSQGDKSTVLKAVVGGDRASSDVLVPVLTVLETVYSSTSLYSYLYPYSPPTSLYRYPYPPAFSDEIVLGEVLYGGVIAGRDPSASEAGVYVRQQVSPTMIDTVSPDTGVFLVKSTPAVPEPSAWVLMALGLLGLGFVTRR